MTWRRGKAFAPRFFVINSLLKRLSCSECERYIRHRSCYASPGDESNAYACPIPSVTRTSCFGIKIDLLVTYKCCQK